MLVIVELLVIRRGVEVVSTTTAVTKECLLLLLLHQGLGHCLVLLFG